MINAKRILLLTFVLMLLSSCLELINFGETIDRDNEYGGKTIKYQHNGVFDKEIDTSTTFYDKSRKKKKNIIIYRDNDKNKVKKIKYYEYGEVETWRTYTYYNDKSEIKEEIIVFEDMEIITIEYNYQDWKIEKDGIVELFMLYNSDYKGEDDIEVVYEKTFSDEFKKKNGYDKERIFYNGKDDIVARKYFLNEEEIKKTN